MLSPSEIWLFLEEVTGRYFGPKEIGPGMSPGLTPKPDSSLPLGFPTRGLLGNGFLEKDSNLKAQT